MARNRLERAALLLVRTGLVLALVIVTTSVAGTPLKEDEGSGEYIFGGFSSGSWGGPNYQQPEFNEDYYEFGIVLASKGFSEGTSAFCDFSTAVHPRFPSAAQELLDAGAELHAFWFLTSYDWVTQTCPSLNPFPESEFEWGQLQANWFLLYVHAAGFKGLVSGMFGDVERWGGSTCGTDQVRWECDTPDENREVVRGFAQTIAQATNFDAHDGVYTNPLSEWPEVTDDAPSSTVGTNLVWMSSYCPVLPDGLVDQSGYFSVLGYDIFSWQYVINDSEVKGCGTCEVTYEMAKDAIAAMPAPLIHRFDAWTNESPHVVCGVND